jgi:putative sigma-54 modulation protein
LGHVQVVIEVEKYRHAAEAKLTLNGTVIQAKASTKEMYTSIDLLLDRIARQVARRKEKLVNHKPRSEGRRVGVGSRTADVKVPKVVTRSILLPILTMEEAMERLSENPSAEVIFLNAGLDRVQIMRQLVGGEIEVVDPRPAPPRIR